MMRPARIISLLVTTVLLASRVSAQSRDEEMAKVYTAALEVLYSSMSESPPFIIVGDTLESDRSLSYGGKLFVKDSAGISLATILDFEKVSRSLREGRAPGSLMGAAFPRFRYRIPLVRMTRSLRQEVEHLGYDAADDSLPADWKPVTALWRGMPRKFPHAWGITIFTGVGFDEKRSEALVEVRHICGNGCGSVEGYFLRKSSKGWRVVERLRTEYFERRDVGEFRYLGSDKWMLARQRGEADSTRRAIADSLKRMRMPRSIRGTITSTQTGRPIPFAQVLLYQPHWRPDGTPPPMRSSSPPPDAHVVADRNGRYVIKNPAIGSAMLIFVCSGKIRYDRASFGAPSLNVFPGSYTTFDFAAQDLSPCWPPTKVHSLESGWFESAEARNASVPDEEESRVLTVALGHLRSISPTVGIVGMFTRTMLPCRFDRLCGVGQLPRLVHEGDLDWSTFEDFRVRSAKTAILKPGFAESLGLHVVSDQEFHYFSGEAMWPIGWPAHDAEEDSTRFWKSFKKIYGNSAAIASVTRVGFNTQRTEALVEVRIDSALNRWQNTPSRMFVLRRKDDIWNVDNDDVGRGTTSGSLEGDVCFASSPPRETVSKSEIENLDGMFDLTIVGTGETERRYSRLLRIGHRMRASWFGKPPSPDAVPPTLGHSFEVLDKDGKVDAYNTMYVSIIGIPRNVVMDPKTFLLDPPYQNLTILRLTDSGFAGSLVGGMYGDSDFGYFCARRVTRH